MYFKYIINKTTKRIPYFLYFLVSVRKLNIFLYDLKKNKNQTKTKKPSLSLTAIEHHTDATFPNCVHKKL